jgi:outer membrane receptor protein involved in Fe transport
VPPSEAYALHAVTAARPHPARLRFDLTLAAGEWEVRAGAASYLEFKDTVRLADGEIRTLEILLVHRQAYEESVDVTAPHAAPERPVAIPVETRQVLATAGTADNIFHVLQTLPGVAPTEEFGSRLSVRGGSPDQNLTIMDGVEIHNPYRLFGLTSAFNPETVRRFELTAGGFGAAYGGSAPGERGAILAKAQNASYRCYASLSCRAPLGIEGFGDLAI